MPWTLSHAAVVLPLRRLGPLPLSLPALVVGSMTPDAPYYLGMRELGLHLHTVAGSVFAGWPLGLAILAAVGLLRRPLCHLLPRPHRNAVAARFDPPLRWHALGLASVMASMLVGVWSHLLCDLFTHAPPPGFPWLAWLAAPVATVAGRPLLAHTVMQVVTSAIGVVILVVAYRRWLRDRWPSPAPAGHGAQPTAGSSDRWRWILQAVLLAACGTIGAAYAASTAPPITTIRELEQQVFRALVMATMWYLPWLVLSALVSYWHARRRALLGVLQAEAGRRVR